MRRVGSWGLITAVSRVKEMHGIIPCQAWDGPTPSPSSRDQEFLRRC